jgi:hypothetical protein
MTSSAKAAVYLSELFDSAPGSEEMRFRLVYEGPLQSKQRDAIDGQRDPSALHTHAIRRQFHEQLKRLWKTNRFLNEHRSYRSDFSGPQKLHSGSSAGTWGRDANEREPLVDIVADLYSRNGYRFVPLVRGDWHLSCGLQVLFLRHDIPGSVIQAGDIDNRLKTLLDALRMPGNAAELAGSEVPQDGEDPFFVLLEDDKFVTGLSVETDTLLTSEPTGQADGRNVHLIISVEIRPYYTTTFNLSFA